MNTITVQSAGMHPQASIRSLLFPLVATALVAVLWAFPKYWYVRGDEQQIQYWLSCQTNIPGWSCKQVPVGEAAEAVLAADELSSAQLVAPSGRMVQVFSAKRYAESGNEVGLFIHTPDRCWTEAGWTLETAAPDNVELTLHGLSIHFERRVFNYKGHRELVYFAGLVGGRPLPYRLDHNLSVGLRFQSRPGFDEKASTLRVADGLLWRRLAESFFSRRALVGPKQFVRISTSASLGESRESDELLQRLLPELLILADYGTEMSKHALEARSE
jgi:hypothetical protein